jgi:hypothetical protein
MTEQEYVEEATQLIEQAIETSLSPVVKEASDIIESIIAAWEVNPLLKAHLPKLREIRKEFRRVYQPKLFAEDAQRDLVEMVARLSPEAKDALLDVVIDWLTFFKNKEQNS